MEQAGILLSKGGKVRLLRLDELPADWDPATDPRLTACEVVHQLIRVLEEIKNFLGPSTLTEFHPALGQFTNNRYAVKDTEPDCVLYLAVRLLCSVFTHRCYGSIRNMP